MTLIEMQKVLGSEIAEVTAENITDGERPQVIERAEYTAKLAKQMVKTADIILRTDKLCGRTDRINEVVGK